MLSELQVWLEHICYAYCNSYDPSVLKARKCDCPERLSLQEWVALILKQKGRFRQEIKPGELHRLLRSAQEVTALASHRTQVDVNKIEKIMVDCQALAMALGVESYGRAVGVLWLKVRGVLSSLAVRETKLKTKIEGQLNELATQKAEIINREDKARDELEAGLDKYQSRAQVAVVKAIREASEVRLRVDTEGNDIDSDESGASVVVDDY